MTRLLLLVEGQTEETFVRDVLGPHLSKRNVHCRPITIATKRTHSGGKFRGGVVSTEQVRRELDRLLQDSDAHVSTIVDYYGLPEDFYGMAQRPAGDSRERVEFVEAAWGRAVQRAKFVPHVVLHEFEAWLYSAPVEFAREFDPPGVAHELERIATRAGGPEHVDDGPATAPSKRLLELWPAYQKPLDGPRILQAMGLARVRSVCPHFDAWLARLESLGTSAT